MSLPWYMRQGKVCDGRYRSTAPQFHEHDDFQNPARHVQMVQTGHHPPSHCGIIMSLPYLCIYPSIMFRFRIGHDFVSMCILITLFLSLYPSERIPELHTTISEPVSTIIKNKKDKTHISILEISRITFSKLFSSLCSLFLCQPVVLCRLVSPLIP